MPKTLILIIAVLYLAIITSNCTSSDKPLTGTDETHQKVVIGYVDAEPLYLIKINDRIAFVIDKIRTGSYIFYNPNPDELFFLYYVSLNREIRKTGLGQPGATVLREEVVALADRLKDEKINSIYDRFNKGATIDEIISEFELDDPKSPQKIMKGDIPEWDEVLWKSEDGKLSETFMSKYDQRIYFFYVHGKGADNEGKEWVEATILYFPIPMETAQHMLEDELQNGWAIKLNNGFFSALKQYFHNDVIGAENTLSDYLTKKGRNDSFAHYFMARILGKKFNKTNEAAILDQVEEHLQNAIKHSRDAKIIPYFRYDLGLRFLETGQREKALEQFRLAMNETVNNLDLSRKLASEFESLGDDEYLQKAKEMIEKLEKQIETEIMFTDRVVPSSSRVKTGEGFLFEDVNEILSEVKAARKIEESLDFSKLE